MFKCSFQNIPFVAILSFTSITVTAQKVQEPKTDSNWVKPYQPFRIAGNLYYVGTYDLGCYLITTANGNILINTGTASSAEQIKKNIQTLCRRIRTNLSSLPRSKKGRSADKAGKD